MNAITDIFNMQEYLADTESAYKAPTPDRNSSHHT